MNPIILERDTHILDWRAHGTSFSTSAVNGKARSYRVRSDGILHPNYSTISVHEEIATTSVKQVRCAGVNMAGPEPGLDFTPYAISCVAMSGHINQVPILVVGESIATITSDAGGDLITEVHTLDGPVMGSTEYSTLNYQRVILVNENTAGRGICFAIGMLATAGTASTALAWCHMSVRRLIGIDPAVLDTRKL